MKKKRILNNKLTISWKIKDCGLTIDKVKDLPLGLGENRLKFLKKKKFNL